MKRIIVFDVIETLLDLKALKPNFEALCGHPDSLERWFSQLIQTALVQTGTDRYADFGSVGRHALSVIGARQGRVPSDEAMTELLGGIVHLPAHPDCAPSLERLRGAGFRLATLTNSTIKVATAQLQNSGLAKYFEQVLSVDTVRRFKPAPEVYQMTARAFGVSTSQIRLVAAHDWDVTGAMRAGAAAAFVARPGMVLGPLSEKPDVVGADLAEVADKIIEIEQ